MTASQTTLEATPIDAQETKTVTAPDLATPDSVAPSSDKKTTDLQTDAQNFRLDEAIEGLRNSSLEMKAKTEAEQETRASREAAIWDIAVDVQVVLGTLNLTVADLLAMKPDTSFPLGMAGDTPLELVAGGHTIGWCELVAPDREGDALSIRITKLSGPRLPQVVQPSAKAG